ncbi:MAG TPA: hypothetical protein VH277_02240 [Gemmatimonadaceae bacterium]|nr:hypothetical protein [Gemmatimonadaceae bacterium]
MSVESSESELLAACREGSLAGVELLVDMHAAAGVSLALRIAQPAVPDEELLDLVHDAFITAFDEALESEAHSLTFVFHGLIRMFLERGTHRADSPADERADASRMVRELRSDLVQELRVMIAIYAETPGVRTPAQRLLSELRALRRRLQFRVDVLRSKQPFITVQHGDKS